MRGKRDSSIQTQAQDNRRQLPNLPVAEKMKPEAMLIPALSACWATLKVSTDSFLFVGMQRYWDKR